MGKRASEPVGRAGSDFFIVLGLGWTIRPEYAVIGQVGAGIRTVKRIGSLGTEAETPSRVIKIEAIRIRRR